MDFFSSQTITDELTIEFSPYAGKEMKALPVDGFSVRKVTAFFANGKSWLYADIVPFDHPYWPNTYNTSIHAWSSPDGRDWTYHGEVLPKGERGQWDCASVSTPGAVTLNGKVYLFYTGMDTPDGRNSNIRHIGLAVADDPAGPFIKNPEPIQVSQGYLDDSSPVVSVDGKTIYHYFRESFSGPDSKYRIRMSKSLDYCRTWSEPVDIFQSDSFIRAYESLEAKPLDGSILLFCFEFPGKSPVEGKYKSGAWISADGINFTPCRDKYLDDCLFKGWEKPLCGFQFCLIPNGQNMYCHIGVAQSIDANGNYNTFVIPIKPLPALETPGLEKI